MAGMKRARAPLFLIMGCLVQMDPNHLSSEESIKYLSTAIILSDEMNHQMKWEVSDEMHHQSKFSVATTRLATLSLLAGCQATAQVGTMGPEKEEMVFT